MAYELLDNDFIVDDAEPRVPSRFWRKFGHVTIVAAGALLPTGYFAYRAYDASGQATKIVEAGVNSHGLDSSSEPINNAVADSLFAVAGGLAGGLASNAAYEAIVQVVARRQDEAE